jgi:hypothetical protein
MPLPMCIAKCGLSMKLLAWLPLSCCREVSKRHCRCAVAVVVCRIGRLYCNCIQPRSNNYFAADYDVC